VNVIYGGTVEIETDNFTLTGTATPGSIIYVGADGVLTDDSSDATAIGWLEDTGSSLGTTTYKIRLVLS
jgi:hypothetical protein